MAKTLIKNVKIVDGTGAPAYHGHLIIKEGKIESILKDLPSVHTLFDETINGEGYTVTPGFIDSHSHSDLMIFKEMFLKPKLRQGITTEVLGQDGVSVAPLPMQYVTDWRKNLAGLDGEHESFNWSFGDIKGYLTVIDNSHTTSNATYLIPHGNVRMAAMGFDNRKPTVSELDDMCGMVDEAMAIGCPGLSAGLIYTPGAFALEEELIELCKVVSRYDGVFVVHQRSEAGNIMASMEELFRIARASGVRLHISHFKLCGRQNWHLIGELLAKVDEGIEEGIEITFDMYPYTAGSTMLSAIIPPWGREGGTEIMLARLKDHIQKKKLIRDILSEGCEWDNFVEFAGTAGIYITDVGTTKNQWAVGKNLNDIGSKMGMGPVEAAFQLLIEENNHVSMVDFYGNEEHLERFISRDEGVVCTDGLLGGKAHPRVYGAFPRVIDQYVNKKSILTLEQAIHKMTGLPAKIFGLKKRGIIKEGYWADLVLLDEIGYRDTNSYESPHSYPEGLHMVMVNGHIIYDKEAWHLHDCGQLLLKEVEIPVC